MKNESIIIRKAISIGGMDMKNIKYNKREMGEVGLGSSLTGATSTRVKRLESEDAEKMLKAWL